MEEGQLVPAEDGFAVNYYLRDHLGNVRMVIDQEGEVVQETEYYAFGLPVTRSGTDAENKYLYNGKEKQAETQWLDYGPRMYMPEIGRWSKIDRASEKYYFVSPYSYGLNNSFLNIDLSGDTTYSVNDLPDNWDQFDQNNDQVNLAEVKVVRPNYQKMLDDIYFEEYAKFSPWLPDAYSIQINASASGIFTDAGFNVGIAMDSKGVAPFGSTGIGMGGAPPGIDFSIQFNMSERIDRSKPHKNLSFVNGVDIGNSYGLGFGFSKTQTSALGHPLNVDPEGYTTYGLQVGLSLGYKRAYSIATSIPIDFRKR